MENNMNNETNLSGIDSRYQAFFNRLKGSGDNPEDLFLLYNKDNLSIADTWYEALATLEYALDKQTDIKRILPFMKMVFYSNDCNASVDLEDKEYSWFWQKIHALLDRVTAYDAWAFVEKGLQYYTARREYRNNELALEYMEKAATEDEYAGIILGYYLYGGFCGKTDKERGRKLVENVTSEKNKVWSSIYQTYIALIDEKPGDAVRIISTIEPDWQDEREVCAVKGLQGLLAEINGKPEEAQTCFNRVLEIDNNGLAFFHLGQLHINGKIKQADAVEGLCLLEKAFRFGHYGAANNLAYYYNPELENPWKDFSLYIKWLEKGYLYGQSYSAFELSTVYLSNEEYKDIEKGLACLEYAVTQDYEDALLRKAYFYFEGEFVEPNLTQSIELLQRAIGNGSGYAAYRLALLHEQGKLSDGPDYQTALTYYRKAADLGHPYGYDLAGRSYRYGYTGEPDLEKAKEYFEKGTALNSGFSAVELAFMYEEGVGVERDYKKAYELYRQAAENNYPYAMLRLGIYEENGYAGGANVERAFEWYKRAAENENAEAMFRLGRCYKYAIGTTENPDLAIEWLEKGAAEKDVQCLTELALCYQYEYGVEENAAKVVEYMSEAAEAGYAYAQYKMGTYYMDGYGTIEENHATAIAWYEKAIENENPNAMIEMGDYYLYDYDRLQQYDKAFPFYKQALEYDRVNEGLGYCFFFGYGVESNEPEAFKYFLMAAERGYVRAMYRTGLAYYYGWGIKENKEEAYRWFNDAAQDDIAAAQYYLGKMLINGEGCAVNVETGIQWLRKGAENEDGDAQFEMGNCYLLGRGVEENPDIAMEWFEKAADNGHEQAMKVVGRNKRRH